MPDFHDRRDGSHIRLPQDFQDEGELHQANMSRLEQEIRNASGRAESVLPISQQKAAPVEDDEEDNGAFMRRYEAEMKALANKPEEIRPISEQKKNK